MSNDSTNTATDSGGMTNAPWLGQGSTGIVPGRSLDGGMSAPQGMSPGGMVSPGMMQGGPIINTNPTDSGTYGGILGGMNGQPVVSNPFASQPDQGAPQSQPPQGILGGVTDGMSHGSDPISPPVQQPVTAAPVPGSSPVAQPQQPTTPPPWGNISITPQGWGPSGGMQPGPMQAPQPPPMAAAPPISQTGLMNPGGGMGGGPLQAPQPPQVGQVMQGRQGKFKYIGGHPALQSSYSPVGVNG